MQPSLTPLSVPSVQLPVMAVAELQDSLLVVMHDLQRLEGLLNHAGDNLLDRFTAANQSLSAIAGGDASALEQARCALQAAVTELQFQDMASQLIVHTTKVVQGCAYRLASEAMGHDEDEAAAPFGDPGHDRRFFSRGAGVQGPSSDEFGNQIPDRPNPVTQSEMDAGSIELF
ncbi:MAG: hypothetical protein WCH44_04715 [Betaproteobacteria bacterium]